MTTPLVSVCIPVFNCERYIGKAIESVLGQTCQDWDLVIVDNASTDRTVEIVSSFNDPRLRLQRNQRNIGAMPNFNVALSSCRGKYIKMLGADDVLYPRCLERQAEVLERDTSAEISLVCSPRDFIDGPGAILMKSQGPRHINGRMAGRNAVRRVVRLGRNWLGEPVAVMFRNDALTRVGGFDEITVANVLVSADVDLWCRLLQVGDLFVLPEAVGAFRVNAGSASIEAAKQGSKHLRYFLRSLRERNMGDISRLDLALGSLRAMKYAWMRPMLYLYLRLRERLH